MKNLIERTIVNTRKISNEWSRSLASTYAASVAYYAIFSLAPLLFIAISVAGLFLDRVAAQEEILLQFQAIFGDSGMSLVQSLIDLDLNNQNSTLMIIIGFIILLIGASAALSQLQIALDSIFKTSPSKIETGLWGLIKKRLFLSLLVLGFGVILLISLLLSTALVSVPELFSGLIADRRWLISFIEFVFSYALISLFIGAFYKLLSSKSIAWKPALMGGFVSGVLFTITKFFLTWYLEYSHLGGIFGSASALVFVILWVYYTSLVFFLGGIITNVYFIKK